MQYILRLINDLLEKPTNLSTASKYTAMNGLIYRRAISGFVRAADLAGLDTCSL